MTSIMVARAFSSCRILFLVDGLAVSEALETLLRAEDHDWTSYIDRKHSYWWSMLSKGSFHGQTY